MRDMQNSIQPVAVPFWATLLGAIFTVFLWASSAGALPAPTSQQIITPYTAVAAPTINALADASRPIAVGGAADESGDLTLQVHTDSVDAPMDAYLAVLAPRIAPNAILLVNPGGGLELFTGILKPWKSNVTILDETPFGTIPLELLPGGDYFFYLLLAPAGATNPLSGNFYLWSSVLTLTPTVEEFANAVIGQFGTDVDGPMALLLGFDNGYSLQQIVNAVFANRFTSAGIVLDGSGAPAAPANTPQGLIVLDGGVSVQRIMEDLPLTVEQSNLETAIEKLIDALTFGLHVPPWNAYGLVYNALVVSQADHVDLGKVLGAIIAESWLFGVDGITLLDGPADDPNSKPLEGSGEPSGLFRTSGSGGVNFTKDLSRVNKVFVSLGTVQGVFELSDGSPDYTYWVDGNYSGQGRVTALSNSFTGTLDYSSGGYITTPMRRQQTISLRFNADGSAIEWLSANYSITDYPGQAGEFISTYRSLQMTGHIPLVSYIDTTTQDASYRLEGQGVCALVKNIVEERTHNAGESPYRSLDPATIVCDESSYISIGLIESNTPL